MEKLENNEKYRNHHKDISQKKPCLKFFTRQKDRPFFITQKFKIRKVSEYL